MRRIFSMCAGAIATVALAVSAGAQKTTQTGAGSGGSPHVKSEWTIGGAHVSVEYGRPSLKGRAESTMMPAGKVWRTGADQATVITTDKPLRIGNISVAPGSYTLNTQPGVTEWFLLVGKLGKPGQWGVPYDAALEIARTPMTPGKASAPVEQLTIAIDATPAGGTLRIEWGTQSASVPMAVAK